MSEASFPSDGLRDLYERRAELQYGRPRSLPDPRVDRKFERTLRLVAEALPCGDYLDAGCGDGVYLAAVGLLPSPPRRLVGVDISEVILETSRAICAAHGVAAEHVRANLESLPFEDGSFDVVLCAQALEHLLDPDAGLRELARVLRPGGRLILATLNRRMLVSGVLNAPRTLLVRALGLAGRRSPVEFPELRFDARDLASRVERAGLVPLAVETFRFHLRPPLGGPRSQRLLNAVERRLPDYGVGDVLAITARRAPAPLPERGDGTGPRVAPR